MVGLDEVVGEGEGGREDMVLVFGDLGVGDGVGYG